jgi:hypothetical protein
VIAGHVAKSTIARDEFVSYLRAGKDCVLRRLNFGKTSGDRAPEYRGERCHDLDLDAAIHGQLSAFSVKTNRVLVNEDQWSGSCKRAHRQEQCRGLFNKLFSSTNNMKSSTPCHAPELDVVTATGF